jgi:hypothetical protein
VVWELAAVSGASYAHLVLQGVAEVKHALGIACFTIPPPRPHRASPR